MLSLAAWVIRTFSQENHSLKHMETASQTPHDSQKQAEVKTGLNHADHVL